MIKSRILFLVIAFNLCLIACSGKGSPASGCPDGEKEIINTNSSDSKEFGDLNNYSSSEEKSLEVSYGEMTDSRDGRTYKTITLEGRTWMAENLNFEYIVDGSSYGNKCAEEDCGQKGRLYTWAAAMDSAGVFSNEGLGCGNLTACYPYKKVRGICPEGWHIPRDCEFDYSLHEIFVQTFDSVATTVTLDYIMDSYLYPLFWMAQEDHFENASIAYAIKYNSYKTYRTRVYDFIPVRCEKDYEEELPNMIDLRIPKESRFNPNIDYGMLTDSRDGKVYRTVNIGDQVWMAENLNYDAPWPLDSEKVSWCFYDKEEFCDLMGRFYGVKVVLDDAYIDTLPECLEENLVDCYEYGDYDVELQSVCPDGWRLPTKKDWNKLVDAVGGVEVAGQNLASVSGWLDERAGLDTYGFSALPIGEALVDDIDFYVYRPPNRYMRFLFYGSFAHFWLANAVKTAKGYNTYFGSADLTSFEYRVLTTSDSAYYPIRCIKKN